MSKKSETYSLKKEQEPEDAEEESSCGIGSFQPAALQCCKTVMAFSFFYGLVNMITQSLNVYISSQITAIERQFNLNSFSTGIILSANDIGFIASVLVFSHFGKDGHVPRILAVTSFIFGIAGFMASLCHFVDPYELPKLSVDDVRNSSSANLFVAPLCKVDGGNQQGNCQQNNQASGGNSWQMWLLCISMAIQGAVKAPRQPLSTTYIDDNHVDKTKTGIFLAIPMVMLLLGPSSSFLLGGVFRSIPVDLQDTVLTPRHPKWIGAWWIGFVLYGGLAFLVAIPMIFFPKHIINQKQKRKNAEITKLSAIARIKDMPKSVLRVLKRPVFTLVLCGGLSQMFILTGKQAFNSKYVENQFMQPASTVNIMLGVVSFISSATGTMGGGMLTTRLRLTRLGCLRVALSALTVTIASVIMHYFLGCETPFINGFHDKASNISDCSCSSVDYFPVCAEDGSNYFSPCYAGCTNQTNTVYGGCSAIASGQVKAGLCETDCPYLYYYLAVDVVQIISGTILLIPVYILLIRSVEDRDKTIAIGMSAFLSSLLAFLPAPLLYGYVYDTACIVWSSTCGVQGACQQYNLYDLRIRVQSVLIAGLLLTVCFFTTAYIVLKRQGGDQEKPQQLTLGTSGQQGEKVKCADQDNEESSRL